MGFANSLRVKMQFSKRVREAATQMYTHVQAGRSFEVPNGPGTDDLTTRAVMCLRQMHPEVPIVYQGRGVIIGHVQRTMTVSDAAWKELKKGQYLPEAELALNPEAFIADQNQFLAIQRLDRAEQVEEGQRRQAERDRIVMAGGNAVVAERTAAGAAAPDPELETERAAHRVQRAEFEASGKANDNNRMRAKVLEMLEPVAEPVAEPVKEPQP